MKNLLILILVSSFLSSAGAATRRKSDAQITPEAVSLGVTHILPSAFVIPGGTLILGTTLGVGFLDLFDLSTNLYLDFYSVYNVAAKFNLLASQDFAFAIHASYVTQTVKTQSVNPTTLQIVTNSSTSTAISPGVTFSYRIAPRITGHVGGKVVNRTPALTKADVDPKSGFVQGNTVNKEFAFGLGSQTSMAVGASYDLTFSTPGAGISFYLGSFQLGAHYYFGVSEGAVQPLIGGSYTANF